MKYSNIMCKKCLLLCVVPWGDAVITLLSWSNNSGQAQCSLQTSLQPLCQAGSPSPGTGGTSYLDLLRLLPENVPVLLQLFRGFGPRLPGQHVPQLHIQLLLFLSRRKEERLLLNHYSSSTAWEEINLTENCNSVRKVFGETNLPVCH